MTDFSFKIVRRRGEFVPQLLYRGELLFTGEPCERRSQAQAAIESLKANAPTAPIVDNT